MREHGGTIRTEWFEGPMLRDDAERLATLINTVSEPKCGPGAGDRSEGAFATRRHGVQTVGYRGCEIYRANVRRGFTLTAANRRAWARQAGAA